MCGIGVVLTNGCTCSCTIASAAASREAATSECTSQGPSACSDHEGMVHTLMSAIRRRGPDCESVYRGLPSSVAASSTYGSASCRTCPGMHIAVASSVLHMRGTELCRQPVYVFRKGDGDLDGSRVSCGAWSLDESVLSWNGEMYTCEAVTGTSDARGHESTHAKESSDDAASDTAAIAQSLRSCTRTHVHALTPPEPCPADADDLPSLVALSTAAARACVHELTRVCGPYAMVHTLTLTHTHTHTRAQVLLFARDPFGRKSLLFATRNLKDITHGVAHHPGATPHTQVLLSSVCVCTRAHGCTDADALRWTEVPPDGVYMLILLEQGAEGSRSECISSLNTLAAAAGLQSASLHTHTHTHVRDAEAMEEGDAAANGDVKDASCFLLPWPDSVHSAYSWESARAPRVHRCLPAVHTRIATPSTAALSRACALVLTRLAAAVHLRVANLPAHRDSRDVTPPLPKHLYEFPADCAVDVCAALKAVETAGRSRYDLPAVAWNGASGGSVRPARVAVLFSGGLDSSVLAALANAFVPADEAIDLINVCFAPDHASPDRLTAVRAWKELRAVYPTRCWQLICVDSSYTEVLEHQRNILQLIAPALTHMDFNIGASLWFAAQGCGYVDVHIDHDASVRELVTPQATTAATSSGVRSAPDTSLLEAIADEAAFSVSSILESVAMHGTARSTADAELPADVAADVTRWYDAQLASAASDVVMTPVAHSMRAIPVEHLMCRRPVADGTPPCAASVSRKCTYGMCTKCCVRELRAARARGEVRAGCKLHGPVEKQAATVSATAAAHSGGTSEHRRVLVRSRARVLLNGIGADEQFAGYGRHRTCFAAGGWSRLWDELRLDCSRLWKRNFGRDDRIVSDHGRELRLPFMDEHLRAVVRQLPLPFLTDLTLPAGLGDKLILRAATWALRVRAPAVTVKRAIHFGTRIAVQSNRHAFGSNKAGRGDVAALGLAELAAGDDEE